MTCLLQAMLKNNKSSSFGSVFLENIAIFPTLNPDSNMPLPCIVQYTLSSFSQFLPKDKGCCFSDPQLLITHWCHVWLRFSNFHQPITIVFEQMLKINHKDYQYSVHCIWGTRIFYARHYLCANVTFFLTGMDTHGLQKHRQVFD